MTNACIRLAAALLLAVNVPATQGAAPDGPAGDWRGAPDPGPAAPQKRPQEPNGPVPYLVEEVFIDGPGMIRLAGTVTRPDSTGASPGIVLVAGAGPHDRDGTFLNHRPLLVLADHLTRAGFAVLRFDERGVGDSEGAFASATAEQLAGDIAAGAEFLRLHDGVDPGRVGILAHSEGGRISALAIQAHDAADFLVLLGAPARPGIEELRVQAEQSASPVARLQAAMAEATLQVDGDQEVESYMRHVAEDLLNGLTKGQRARFGGREDMIVDQLVQALGQPQARFSLDYDPRAAVQQASIPVLALYGEKDRQIDAVGSAQAWREVLGDEIETELLAGLNHFFQKAETGAPSEYSRIEQTIAHEALTAIIDWLMAVTGGDR